jgi:GDPmannose 4,6-dehydratase
MAKKTALITGITGQDGSYLAELLLRKGYRVAGTTRDAVGDLGPNLAHLKGQIDMLPTSYERESLIDVLQKVQPDEVYNFAGQTYVGKSWGMVDETFRASAYIPTSLLEAIVKVNKRIRYFQASSSEVFTLDWDRVICEESPQAPGNPYGCSKAYAHNMVACFRRNYDLFAVNGILFQHESPRRHENFASRKIAKTAVAVKLGRADVIELGALDVSRDWSYAPDIVVAIDAMMRIETPQDLVICSGENHTVREVAETIFDLLGLDFSKYYRLDQTLVRALEPPITRGSSEKIKKMTNWRATTSFRGLLEKMVDYEMRLQSGTEHDFVNERPFE